MISLTVRASDHTEGTVVADAEVRVTLRIVGWIFVNMLDPQEPGNGPSAPGPGPAGPGPGVIALRVVSPRGTFGHRQRRAARRRASAQNRVPTGHEDLPEEVLVTDAQGSATFQWNTSPGSPFDLARRRVLADPRHPSIELQLRLTASCDGIVLSLEPLTTLQESASLTQLLTFDFAKAIVGHTTERACTLWFCLHGSRPNNASYFCEVLEPRLPVLPRSVEGMLARELGRVVARLPIGFDEGSVNITSVEVSSLEPGTSYWYRLVLERPGEGSLTNRRILAAGSFSTAKTDEEEVRIAFASCYKLSLPERLVALANEPRDLTILMGDQIYEPQYPSGSGWFDAYVNRYQHYWRPRQFRDIVRRCPTYMIFDDHEVSDDWGSAYTQDTEDFQDRVTSALRAYRLFQDSHNPQAVRRWREDKYHYSFQRGRAAFFVLDERSHRGRPHGSPILGADQREELLRWSQAEETRNADVIVLVSSVPLAFLPTDTLLQLLNTRTAGAILGAAAGGLLGFLGGGGLLGSPGGVAGGLLGIGQGAIVGWTLDGEAIVEDLTDGAIEWRNERLVSPDLVDHWSTSENQNDLRFVLDVLFELRNDVIDGGTRPRLVFVLAGDTHVAAAHTIQSTKPEHAPRSTILQLMSSPLSRDSLGAKNWLDRFGFLTDGFPLVSSGEYRARLHSEWLDEPNFGTLSIQRRTSGPGRVYVVSWTLEGRTHTLSNAWPENLDG